MFLLQLPLQIRITQVQSVTDLPPVAYLQLLGLMEKSYRDGGNGFVADEDCANIFAELQTWPLQGISRTSPSLRDYYTLICSQDPYVVKFCAAFLRNHNTELQPLYEENRDKFTQLYIQYEVPKWIKGTVLQSWFWLTQDCLAGSKEGSDQLKTDIGHALHKQGKMGFAQACFESIHNDELKQSLLCDHGLNAPQSRMKLW
jgi:hypothetical protein